MTAHDFGFDPNGKQPRPPVITTAALVFLAAVFMPTWQVDTGRRTWYRRRILRPCTMDERYQRALEFAERLAYIEASETLAGFLRSGIKMADDLRKAQAQHQAALQAEIDKAEAAAREKLRADREAERLARRRAESGEGSV